MPPNAGAGRRVGSVNRITKSAKEAFTFAFDGLGGGHGLLRWARKSPENLTDFYKLYARLIPTETHGRLEVQDITPQAIERALIVARAKIAGQAIPLLEASHVDENGEPMEAQTPDVVEAE